MPSQHLALLEGTVLFIIYQSPCVHTSLPPSLFRSLSLSRSAASFSNAFIIHANFFINWQTSPTHDRKMLAVHSTHTHTHRCTHTCTPLPPTHTHPHRHTHMWPFLVLASRQRQQIYKANEIAKGAEEEEVCEREGGRVNEGEGSGAERERAKERERGAAPADADLKESIVCN